MCVCVCVCMYIDHSTAYTIRGIIYVLSILKSVKLVNLKYGIKKHNKILIVGYYDLIEFLNKLVANFCIACDNFLGLSH